MIQCDATSGAVRCDKDMDHEGMHASSEGSLLSMWASGGKPAPCGFYDEYSAKLCVLPVGHEGDHGYTRRVPDAVVQAES